MSCNKKIGTELIIKLLNNFLRKTGKVLDSLMLRGNSFHARQTRVLQQRAFFLLSTTEEGSILIDSQKQKQIVNFITQS